MLDPAPRRPDAQQRMTQRRSTAPDERFQALPAPSGAAPYRIALAERLAPAAPDAIRFHCLGDTGGHRDPGPQCRVAAAMAAEQDIDFLFHLGDVVYPHGEAEHYRAQFELPYAGYAPPIFAVPGNHDAENGLLKGELALAPFSAHFCSDSPPLHEAGVPSRPPARQPHVHFTLVHERVRIVGLWANVPEGGQFADDQLRWLIGELRDTPSDVVLVIGVHQPVYSADVTHGGNLALAELLDECAEEAGRGPDAVFSGHAHLYERFTRAAPDGRRIPYVVAGAGGYPEIHPLAEGVGPLPHAFPGVPGVTLDACEDTTHGFLTVTVGAGGAEAAYTAVGRDGGAVVVDRFAIAPPVSSRGGGAGASPSR